MYNYEQEYVGQEAVKKKFHPSFGILCKFSVKQKNLEKIFTLKFF